MINYQQKIKELETKHKDLEKKITHFHEEQPKILYEGRNLYNHIMEGGTTARWGDEDYFNFIEYYKLIDLPFVNHLEDDYKKLSTRNMMFMILFNMDKNDKEVAKIMGVAEDSIRMTKTRLREKRKA